MRLNKTQVAGVIILAIVLASLMFTGTARAASTDTGWHRVTQAQRAHADRAAMRAIRTIVPHDHVFNRCIANGYRIVTSAFVGRECVARVNAHGLATMWYYAGRDAHGYTAGEDTR